MSSLRWMRWAALPAVAPVLMFNLGGIGFVRDAYPADPFRSEALANCAATDPAFIRFLPSARAHCYAHQPRLARQDTPDLLTKTVQTR